MLQFKDGKDEIQSR